jgi:hypothetical protein
LAEAETLILSSKASPGATAARQHLKLLEDEMTSSRTWPTRLACSVVVAGAWIACAASAQEVATDAAPALPETSAEPAAAPPVPAPQSGLIACIDPETGELVDPSDNPECRQDLEAADQRALTVDELEEEPVETGGFKVDLKGRFMKPLYATMKEGGGVDLRRDAPTLEADK